MAPILVCLKGSPGSGKSTLARELARRLGWALIDKDDARDAFQSLTQQHPGVDWNSLSYDVMFRYAATQLACGNSVIFDSPLARRALFDRAREMAEQAGAALVLIECEAGDAEVWRQRVEDRGRREAGTPQAHKPGSWEAVQAVKTRNANSEAWSEREPLRWRLRVDTTAPLRDQAAAVQQLLLVVELPGHQGGGSA